MIGIITFHGSHNYGSMLQAYALQQILKELDADSEIINFRMKSQKEYYALYQTKYGVMRFLRSMLLIPVHIARSKRKIKFETFLNTRYVLSGKELETYNDLKSVSEKYDIYLSGSDQIWSDSVPEFVRSKIDYTGVYFLNFVSKDKWKISYASSIGETEIDGLKDKKELILQYKAISTREKRGAEIIELLTGSKVETVIDPTLLLSKDNWRKISGSRMIKEKYIFLYTLQGIRPGFKWMKHLKRLGKKLGYKIVCVSPFFPIISPGIKCLINVGPEDFINLIDNAECVFTDSFHGTAFSINMNRPFYSLTLKGRKDVRKINLLKSVGLESRNLSEFEQIDTLTDISLDYSEAIQKLERLRCKSCSYLRKSINM